MPIKIGETAIGAIKVGQTNISKAYVGSQQVFSVASGPRYLTANDFSNQTTLYSWRAGASGILTTVYGGIDLLAYYDDGYNTDTDHLGNSVKCLSDDDLNLVVDKEALFFPPDEDFTLFIWVKLEDWETTELQTLISSNSYDTSYSRSSSYILFIDNGNIKFFVGDESGETAQNDVAHNLTGNGWHSIAVTRNVTGTETKIWLDGSVIDTQSIATSYSEYSFDYSFFAFYPSGIIPPPPTQTCDISGTEVWVHRGALDDIAALHAVGVPA